MDASGKFRMDFSIEFDVSNTWTLPENGCLEGCFGTKKITESRKNNKEMHIFQICLDDF